MLQVLDQYDDSNIGEWLHPRDPEVLGQMVPDAEDPAFQEFIQAKEELKQLKKAKSKTPSSFIFMDADEVLSCKFMIPLCNLRF